MADEEHSPNVVVWLPISGREAPDMLVEIDHDGNPAGQVRLYRAPSFPGEPTLDAFGLIAQQSVDEPDSTQ